MTYLKPALAHGLTGWNSPQCAAAVAVRRQSIRTFLLAELDRRLFDSELAR